MTNQFLYHIIYEVGQLDYNYLIKYFQSYNIYNNPDSSTKGAVLDYLKSDAFLSGIDDKLANKMQVELTNYLGKLQANQESVKYRKLITDYQNQINMLKAQDSRDVSALNQLNSAMISSDYDKLIKDRANIGTQITFLQNQIIQFQKNIPQ